jgi:hypothetical protein
VLGGLVFSVIRKRMQKLGVLDHVFRKIQSEVEKVSEPGNLYMHIVPRYFGGSTFLLKFSDVLLMFDS